MKLKRNVVMLPTNEKASTNGLVINPFTNKIEYNDIVIKKGAKYYTDVAFTYNHLYITSDEKIKEGDWYIDDTNAVRQSVTSDDIYWKSRTDYKKIIATTDKSLTTSEIVYPEEFIHNLPSPSPEFVQAYIKAYNAGESITDVMVEYEEYAVGNYGMSDGEPDIDIRLKVDKNNCITITKVRDSFTRKDMVEFGKYAFAMAYSTKDTALSFEELLDNFEQTLKS